MYSMDEVNFIVRNESEVSDNKNTLKRWAQKFQTDPLTVTNICQRTKLIQQTQTSNTSVKIFQLLNISILARKKWKINQIIFENKIVIYQYVHGRQYTTWGKKIRTKNYSVGFSDDDVYSENFNGRWKRLRSMVNETVMNASSSTWISEKTVWRTNTEITHHHDDVFSGSTLNETEPI